MKKVKPVKKISIQPLGKPILVGQPISSVPSTTSVLYLPNGTTPTSLIQFLQAQQQDYKLEHIDGFGDYPWIVVTHYYGVGGVFWQLQLLQEDSTETVAVKNTWLYTSRQHCETAFTDMCQQLQKWHYSSHPTPCMEGLTNLYKIHFHSIPNDKPNTSKYSCPVCNTSMHKIDGKFGMFYGCDNYPDCQATLNEWGKPSKKTKILILAKQKLEQQQAKQSNIKTTLSMDSDIDDRLEGLLDE